MSAPFSQYFSRMCQLRDKINILVFFFPGKFTRFMTVRKIWEKSKKRRKKKKKTLFGIFGKRN